MRILIRIEIYPNPDLPIERGLTNPNSNLDCMHSHEINSDWSPHVNRVLVQPWIFTFESRLKGIGGGAERAGSMFL